MYGAWKNSHDAGKVFFVGVGTEGNDLLTQLLMERLCWNYFKL
jgi:hypothetical protein